jgi:hypothetical protein
MQPEISNRCRSCGAAVREADALFCPECGKPLHEEAEASVSSDATEAAAPQPTSGDTKDSETGASSAASPSPDDDNQSNEPVEASRPESGIANAEHVENAKTTTKAPTSADAIAASQSPRRGDKTRERLHRASAVARGVVEGEVKRVEKIRHVSTTIVEEASYDPSLRFVLVAMGLFVVFVILLVLSKVMG